MNIRSRLRDALLKAADNIAEDAAPLLVIAMLLAILALTMLVPLIAIALTK